MNWEAIGAIGEVGGMLLVGVSLIFLAFQLRQSTRTARLANAQNILEATAAQTHDLAMNQGMSDILRRAAEGEKLEGTDFQRLTQYILSVVRRYQNIHYQYRNGMLDEVLFNEFERRFGFFLSAIPAIRPVVEYAIGSLDPEFREWANRILAAPEGPHEGEYRRLLQQESQ